MARKHASPNGRSESASTLTLKSTRSPTQTPSSARRRAKKRKAPLGNGSDGVDGDSTNSPVRSSSSSSNSQRAARTGAEQHLRKKQLAHARTQLPVHRFKQKICQLIRDRPVLLVVAETGSGKSTQIPAYLHESGIFRSHRHAQSICVTQPRRVAAMTVAKRVADETGCIVGTSVGYRVRFDDCTDTNGQGTTRILYLTDGMLLREATSDPLLTRYSVVVLDESHERSLQTDILFGVVKRAMKARNSTGSGIDDTDNGSSDDEDGSSSSTNSHDHDTDVLIQRRMKQRARQMRLPPLKAVVMSATLDVNTFQNFFPDASLIQIPGRMFPVQIAYTKEDQQDYMDSALSTVIQIHEDEEDDGDILVFLPGQEEIEDLASLLRSHLRAEQEFANTLTQPSSSPSPTNDIVQSIAGIGTDLSGKTASIIDGVMICVLYAALPPEAQLFAFAPKPEGCKRKIILSTNIAETSVTLDGIRFVVDCGKQKMREFNGTTGMESLTVKNVSKAQVRWYTSK